MYHRILAQLKSKTKTEWLGSNPATFTIGSNGIVGEEQFEVRMKDNPKSPTYAWKHNWFMRKFPNERKWRLLGLCADKEHFISHIVEDLISLKI